MWTVTGRQGHVSDTRHDRSGAGTPPVAHPWRSTVTYVIAEPCVDVKDKACID